MHKHTLTHDGLETAVDETTVKRIASPGQGVGPHRGDIPAIDPDLHLLDHRYEVFSISPPGVPVMESDKGGCMSTFPYTTCSGLF
jgi:hypothetical protein